MRRLLGGALVGLLVACGAPQTEPGSDAGDTPDLAYDAGPPEVDPSTDAGRPAEADAGTGDGARIPMFVAQGSLGRSTISCDDGRNWVAERSFDAEGDPLVCGQTTPVICGETACTLLRNGECLTQETCDCVHHTGTAKGVTFGNGYFVATWGWGASGSVRRSRDGVNWEETLSDADGAWVAFGGVAFGNDRFVLARRTPYVSMAGADWVEGEEADFRSPSGEIVQSVRDFHFIDGEVGRFVASASPPEAVLISEDGISWRAPTELPAGCLQEVSAGGGVAYGNGATVAVGGDGRVCVSRDEGERWTMQPPIGASSITSRSVIFDGTYFQVWGRDADNAAHRYRSLDGTNWTADAMTPSNIRIGAVARSETTGTYVSGGHMWNGYDRQRFYRSGDGLVWEALSEGSFHAGHNITEITFGYGEASAVCPADE